MARFTTTTSAPTSARPIAGKTITPHRRGLPTRPSPRPTRTALAAALGGPVLPKLVGKKTFFFVNYEGFRFPNGSTIERSVPTALLRAGVIQVPNSAGVYQAYNLNPYPVTVNGVTYQPATCAGGALCDPRGSRPESDRQPDLVEVHAARQRSPGRRSLQHAGLQHERQAAGEFRFWRHPSGSRFREAITSLSATAITAIIQLTSNQIDIGGALPGDKFGQAAASAPRPQIGRISGRRLDQHSESNLVNDFRFNCHSQLLVLVLRGRCSAVAGTGGALRNRRRNHRTL